ERERLLRQFDAILDSLVLPNGVKKTSFARRLDAALTAFLARPERPPNGSSIRVLDLPSSSGVASLDSRALLASAYDIAEYVLADRYQVVYLDPNSSCVYDG